VTTLSPARSTSVRWLWAILLVALALRLGYALLQDPLAPYSNTGSDSAWYLKTGLDLASGADFSHLPPAPIYLIFIGFWQRLALDAQAIFTVRIMDALEFSNPAYGAMQAGAILAIRITQALLATATCYFAYRLARRLTGDARAGLIAAGALALAPTFIIETAQIATETLYLFFLAGGMFVYVEWLAELPSPRRWLALLALDGALFGLATLTRAVPLLFPLGLAIHLLLSFGWRAGIKRAVILLAAYAIMVSTWTMYNVVRFNRFVVGAEGLAAFLYIGATEWTTPTEVDENLAQDASQAPAIDASLEQRQEAYVDAATNVIARDPLGYVRRRLDELAGAYLQPHGTVFFHGESLRELGARWWQDDRSIVGLAALAQAEQFWPKLAVYVFHYTALLAGLAGMWLYRRRWRLALPMIGFIVYTTLVHLILLALPRYVFPTEIFWWVFAGSAISYQFSAVSRQRKSKTRPLVVEPLKTEN
jgi:4-amino-4-deoxy-L-arabinose transferase-like glycosyltransferase